MSAADIAVGQRRRQSLAATVHRACRHCGAPGVYSTEPRIHTHWRACHVPPGSPLDGQPVGNFCPQCGGRRPAAEQLGEIWHKET